MGRRSWSHSVAQGLRAETSTYKKLLKLNSQPSISSGRISLQFTITLCYNLKSDYLLSC